MKTAKKVITISFLTIAIILLIAFGIKTNKFKPTKTTTPLTQHRNTIRVDAEDVITPVSKKWLINYNLPRHNTDNYVGTSTSINFNAKNPYYTNRTYNIFNYVYDSSTNWKLDLKYGYLNNGTQTSTTVGGWYDGALSWNNIGYRIVEFETEPTGSLYTFLEKNATPMYNYDAIIWNGNNTNPLIHQIRKSNIIINNYEYNEGALINQDGQITLYIDAGISQLTINGTNYINNLDQTINITNQDIIIETSGTASGNTSHIFTINYFNTKPQIEPQPYPDASGKVTEVLDITGLMFEILTMPFSFITQAFNVTLWEGTPYQFNFSNFILSLIAIATLIFIIKLFTSGFSVISNYTAYRDNREFKRSQIRLNNSKTELNNRTDPNHKTRDSRSVSVNVNHNYKHKE